MIATVRTDSENPDFIALVRQLDAYLAEKDGDEHSFYAQYNKLDKIRNVILIYENEVPIACGAIKQFEAGSMEVKRMYTLPAYRGKGIASLVLKELEKWATELSCEKCVLETGTRQAEAVLLYQKNGYQRIPNYGQYTGVENSLCFEKILINKMEKIIVREAKDSDLEELYRFEQGIISTERPFDPTLGNDPLHYYDLKAMISDPNVQLLVADVNGKPIGSGYARIEKAKPYNRHKQYAYLGFMYVSPEYRGKGINKMILQKLKEWAASKGLTELRLEVYCKNVSAIRAYEKTGFSQLMILMRKEI